MRAKHQLFWCYNSPRKNILMKIIAKNKRARFDYDIKETIICGVVLAGHEVKSVKAGHISLKGSFVSFKAGEAYLVNSHISLYKNAASIKSYDPTRSRKLLLHRKQIDNLLGDAKTAGLTAVPISVGIERGLVKIEIGVGRGKKLHDKREVAKKKAMFLDAERDIKPDKS